MNNACSFCERLKDCLERDEYDKNSERRAVVKTEYKVSLIQEDYCDGHFTGRLTHRPETLNYCPVCGKKIEGINK